jgi:tRNA(Ile)-lysidine synthase
VALLDRSRISFPLTLRNLRHGDWFIPLGMGGRKKVKDFFIDRKIPSEERAAAAVLVSGDDLVWICGHRIDERFKVTPDTRRVLKVVWTPLSGP